jgi:hypothetical protein
MKKILYLFLLLAINTVFANESFFDTKNKTVNCAEPIPQFTLSHNSSPSDKQVKKLCSCIWASFPNQGWEQKTFENLKAGLKPERMSSELINRFGEALKQCGGRTL